MEKHTKNQHYVHVGYLKNFADEEGFVYVWDKVKDRSFKAHPVDICREDYLYETEWPDAPGDRRFVLLNQIEKTLSKEEGKYSALVRKILSVVLDEKNRGAIVCRDKDERETLASLVANLYLRNPVIIDTEEIRNVPKSIMNHEVVKSIEFILDALGMKGIESMVEQASLRAWVDPKMNNGTHERLVRDLLKADMLFLISEGEPFITSNFPSMLLTNGAQSGIRFYLPLSPKCAVLYDDSKAFRHRRNRIVKLDDEDVRTFNDIIWLGDVEVIKYVISNREIKKPD